MRVDFTHLLITRFNTAIDHEFAHRGLETDWLMQRLALFEKYCLPSVKAQAGVAFKWVVLFDAASPAWVRERVAEYGSIFQPIYISGIATDEKIANVVKMTGYVSAQYLITTRLDNDDALASNHLASVQKAFKYQARQFIAFPFGLQLYRGSLYHVYWRSNPFLSLIERVGKDSEFTTVCCVRHDRVAQLEKVRYLGRSPEWMQVLHTSNLGNTLRGWPRLGAAYHPNFAIEWDKSVPRDRLSRRIAVSAGGYLQVLRRVSGRMRA